MTSRQQTPTQSTGAHRRQRAAPAGRTRADREPERPFGGPGGRREARGRGGDGQRPQGTLPMQPPAHYEPYLDGLFTYCLSILCEHDAAAGAIGEVLAVAERQRVRLRDPGLRRPWLYALARWVCVRRLAHGAPTPPRTSESVGEQRRAQLASLAWPEAAGTTPEQREALELAVRHQLSAREVGLVLGLDQDAARGRLARAACEVERTRTALAVVHTGPCAEVGQLAGEDGVLLGTALRTEIVRHVDECAVCRRTAERVVADGPWPGAGEAAAAVLALVEAPRSAAYAALLHAMDSGFGRVREATPRFDRRGFPVEGGDRAARRARLRHRAVTTTVVAAVVAAPALAVWAAYRATPLGEGHDGGARPAPAAPDGIDGVPYEKAGNAGPSSPPRGRDAEGAAPATSVAVSGGTPPSAAAGQDRTGWLLVAARPGPGRATYVTLTARGAGAVRWEASTAAYWLSFSARSGSLRPGESVTFVVRVDRALEPSGSWVAVIRLSPGDARVTLRGVSSRVGAPPSSPPPASPSPTVSTPPPTTSAPTPPPSDPPSSPTAPPSTPPPPASTSPSP